MLTATLSIIAPVADQQWTEQDEVDAHLINDVLNRGECHCNRKLCASWRKSIAQQNDDYKWTYAQDSLGISPRPLIR